MSGRTPAERWAELKARGSVTAAEIDAIDRDTPWKEVEPRWWFEMMKARAAIAARANHT